MASSRDRGEYVTMETNMLLSQENEMLRASLATTKECDGTVRSTSKGRELICCELCVSLELGLGRFCEKTTSLAAVVND